MPQEPLSMAEFVKAYYKAEKEGLSRTDLARQMGITPAAICHRANTFQKQTGKPLPALKKGKRGPSSGKHQRPSSTKLFHKDIQDLPIVVSAEEFVKAWTTSSSVMEVVKKTGLSKESVRRRKLHYKKAGVKLKDLKGTAALDVKSLNSLIDSLSKKSAEGTDD